MLPHTLQELIAEARRKIAFEAAGPRTLFAGEGVFHAVDKIFTNYNTAISHCTKIVNGSVLSKFTKINFLGNFSPLW